MYAFVFAIACFAGEDSESATKLARWQSGQVLNGTEWISVRSAMKEVPNDYLAALASAGANAAKQVHLAKLCQKLGLSDQAVGHFQTAANLDPKNSEAQRGLGRVLRNGIWATNDERARSKQRSESLARAQSKWVKQLEKSTNWKSDLASLELDPASIQILERLGHMDRNRSLAAVDAMGQYNFGSATIGLVRQAIYSQFPAVRTKAIEYLRDRELDEYVPLFLQCLRPLETGSFVARSSVSRPMYHIFEQTLESGWSFVDENGRNYLMNQGNLLQLIVAAFPFNAGVSGPPDLVIQGSKGSLRVPQGNLPVVDLEQVMANASEHRDMRARNAVHALQAISGETYGDDLSSWTKWYSNASFRFMDQGDIPRFAEDNATVNGVNLPSEIGEVKYVASSTTVLSCFTAGTPVLTRRGPIAIDQVRIGELVLSQSPETGELTYKPVLHRTLRPRTAVKNLRIGDETIGATLGHPIWVSGTGWTKAKDLKSGDPIRTVDSSAELIGVTDGEPAPAYNLVVGDFATYFVGKSAILVHDNTPITEARRPLPGANPLAKAK